MPPLGVRFVILRTAADPGGELVEYEVAGRARGFGTQSHLHPRQTERHEVLAGSLLVRLHGKDRVLGPGDSVELPAATPHRHYAAGTGDVRSRVQLRPAL